MKRNVSAPASNTSRTKRNHSAAASRPKSAAASSDRRALRAARRVLEIEVEALRAVADRLDDDFERAVEMIHSCKGRVVVTGMGKSGLVCRKIASTFASTGTAALFLHAAEAAHGDLGMFARGDVCLAISNSGKTHELLRLLPTARRLRLPVIAITGDASSPLARDADVVLDVHVPQEACPLGLAPTASTTATMAVGDALAVAVLERRGFSEQDFALLHPGGTLGTKLLRVADVMQAHETVPSVARGSSMRNTLEVMTKGGLGVVAVVDDKGALCGVITDGDVRRATLQHSTLQDLTAADTMSHAPKTIAASALAAEALAIMETHAITSLFIVEATTRRPCGIVHLHDLLKAAIA